MRTMSVSFLSPFLSAFARYKQHKTDYKDLPPQPIPLPCQQRGCRCSTYHYVPIVSGSRAPRCSCKHASEDHDARPPHKCMQSSAAGKCSCRAYRTSYRCECGHPSADHRMVVDTREERIAKGKPVGKVVPYAAMGGITGFSSLIDGYMRLDDSGIGAPSRQELESTPMPAECRYFMPQSQIQAGSKPLAISGTSASRRPVQQQPSRGKLNSHLGTSKPSSRSAAMTEGRPGATRHSGASMPRKTK